MDSDFNSFLRALRPHRFESLHRALYEIKVAERKGFSISPGLALRPHRFESLHRALYGMKVAERKGFEPPIPFPVYLISNQAPSATRPPLQRV